MVKTGEPWWKKYRRQQLKVQQVSIELILRKSLKDTAKEYMSNSSLSCVSKIANTRLTQYRAILLIAFCALLGATCYFTIYTISNTLAKPLIVSMESSTYPISDIDFPAVALCNVNRISKKALQSFAKIIYRFVALHNESLREVEWWLYQYGRLLDFTWDDSIGTHPFMDIRSKYHLNTSTIFNRMKLLAPDCEEMLLKCFWAGEQYNCMDLFTVRRTFRGHCCVFNYVLGYNSGGSNPQKTIAKVKRQVEPGPINGLLILADPLIEDYGYPLRNIQGFDVFLFDPAVYLDPYVGRVIHRVLEVNNAMYIELQSIKQVATGEVRKYPWGTRNCLFRDENEMFGDMYSYAACLIHCRIKSVQSLCKCTPYFLPTNIQTTELCTMEKLRCLNKYKEKLLYMFPQTSNTDGLEMEMQDSLYCPECLPDCEFTKHFTRVSKMPRTLDEEYQAKEFVRLLYKNLNSTNMSILSIYQSTSDGTLDRLDVVSYWFEVLSNFGGFAGVVIGFSLISVCEIMYYLCIRFFQLFYENYKRYR